MDESTSDSSNSILVEHTSNNGIRTLQLVFEHVLNLFSQLLAPQKLIGADDEIVDEIVAAI